MLDIEYERGASPMLLLFDADGHEVETINIEGWKHESISAFLSQKLISA